MLFTLLHNLAQSCFSLIFKFHSLSPSPGLEKKNKINFESCNGNPIPQVKLIHFMCKVPTRISAQTEDTFIS